MPHISKKKLRDATYVKINEHFVDAIIRLYSEKRIRSFLNELFTKTEKIMLAKRLAIILMLADDHSLYHIQKILLVSPSTVARLRDTFDAGDFDHILKIFKKEKNRVGYWIDFEALLRAGMPSMGRDRWKGFSSPIKKGPRKNR